MIPEKSLILNANKTYLAEHLILQQQTLISYKARIFKILYFTLFICDLEVVIHGYINVGDMFYMNNDGMVLRSLRTPCIHNP